MSESKDLTKTDSFQPTPAMRVWLDTAIQLMTDNITEIETESKITAQSWYGWLKNDDFRLWFKQEWDKRLAGEAWKLDVIGIKNAKRDHRYWESMQKRVGNLSDDIGEGGAQLNQQNNYINLTDEQLDKLIQSKLRQVGAGNVIRGETEENKA